MLARLELILDNEQIDYRNSSNLQGVIMENIDTGYAQALHEQALNPYSQYLVKRDGITVWCINTLNKEAYENIIKRLIDSQFSHFSIKNEQVKVKIKEKRLITMEKSELMKEFYEEEGQRFYNIEFMTPTSFKSNGKYVIFPNIEMISRSLMKKYTNTSSELDMYDEDTLQQLVECCEITRYKLQSTSFPLERVNIPAYKGSISMKINGNDTISRYIRLLLKFGEYSGVGIKTSIGMGAIRLYEFTKNI